MKRIAIAAALGIGAAVFQTSGIAADAKLAQAALKEHGCLACHEADKKKVGPSFKDVSAKFKGKQAEDVMASMKTKPVHKSVLQKTSDPSLKVIMEWVLTQ